MLFKEVVFPKDLNKLSTNSLREICGAMGLDNTGLKGTMINEIWSNFEKIEGQALDKLRNEVLAGKTAITWFHHIDGGHFKGLREKIISSLDFNPFNDLRIKPINELGVIPEIIGAIDTESEYQYFVRFMHRGSVVDNYHAGENQPIIKTETTTVFIDEENGIIECRADQTRSNKVIKAFGELVGLSTVIDQYKLLSGSSIEKICDDLEGRLFDTVGKPELEIDAFSDEHAKAIVDVLAAIDTYYKDFDGQVMLQSLKEANLDEEYGELPFTSMLLSGLQTVGLGSIGELRGLPLYDYLDPYLQKQHGSIIFKLGTNEFSIKVGKKTQNIFFNNLSNEEVIKLLREKLVIKPVPAA